jgi:hypothetical protein
MALYLDFASWHGHIKKAKFSLSFCVKEKWKLNVDRARCFVLCVVGEECPIASFLSSSLKQVTPPHCKLQGKRYRFRIRIEGPIQ